MTSVPKTRLNQVQHSAILQNLGNDIPRKISTTNSDAVPMNTGSDSAQSLAIQDEIDDLERRLQDANSRLRNVSTNNKKQDRTSSTSLKPPASKYTISRETR